MLKITLFNNFVNKSLLSIIRHSNASTSSKLIPIGILKDIQSTAYSSGQVFLHRQFGYRGIILISWNATIIDKTHKPKKRDEQHQSETVRYYMAIVDKSNNSYSNVLKSDVSYISELNVTEGFDKAHGIDYVSHHDVIPFTPLPTERPPIFNDYFFLFFSELISPDDCFTLSDSFHDWFRSKHHALTVTKIYRETTENVRITVMPFYLGAIKTRTFKETKSTNSEIEIVKQERSPSSITELEDSMRFWRYHVYIENLTGQSLWLRKRTFKLLPLPSGLMECSKGDGVVGMQPLLDNNQPVFQFSSHIRMNANKGHAWGTLTFFPKEGEPYEANIPSFSLECAKNVDLHPKFPAVK